MRLMLRSLVIASLVLFSVAVGSARADEVEEVVTYGGGVTYVFKGTMGKIKVYVYPGYTNVIAFKSPIFGLNQPEFPDLLVEEVPGNVIILHAGVSRPGQWGTFHVQTGHYEAVIEVHGATDPSEVRSAIQVMHVSQEFAQSQAPAQSQGGTAKTQPDRLRALRGTLQALKKERGALKVQLAQITAEHAKTTEQLTAEQAMTTALKAQLDALMTQIERLTAQLADLQQQHDREQQTALAMIDTRTEGRLLDEAVKEEPRKVIRPEPQDGPHIEVCMWKVFGDLRALECIFLNSDPLPYRLADIQVLNEHKTGDHVGAIKIAKRAAPVEPQDGVLAVIPPRGRLQFAVVVREPETLGSQLTLFLSESQGERPIMQGIETWVYEEPAHENEGKVTISVVGSYGAIWIDNPEALKTELDETDIKVFGARVSYGLHKRFNFEAEAAYASTGQARFDDGGVRSARLGRVQLGAALRLGTQRWIPTVRGGAGLQVANYSGLGEGVEVDFLWSLGVGLDRKLGPCIAGLGVLAARQFGNGALSIEPGLHFGCGWKPGKDDD